jgi:hypothetical protein
MPLSGSVPAAGSSLGQNLFSLSQSALMTAPTSNLGSLLGSVPTVTNPLATLASIGTPQPTAYVAPPAPQWIFVRKRFGALIENIGMLEGRISNGNTKQAGVRACLNREYWGHSSDTANSYLVGSWGKQTRVRPSMDIDLLFILPNEVWQRFEGRTGNKQSQLLQEIRGVLANTYGQTTDIRGDGQVVVVPFGKIPVEVVPAFRCADGRLIICDTNNGGSYKYADPLAEIADLVAADGAHNDNARRLTRIMKKWQQFCDVPIKAFQLERLVIEFLPTCWYRTGDYFWYDWMVRDFLAFLIGRANGYVCMPGTNEWISLGDDWLAAAQRAHGTAIDACEDECANRETSAGYKWQELFGSAITVQTQ